MDDKKLKAKLEEVANEAGRKAAASLPVDARTSTRMAIYEEARRIAYNQGMKSAGYSEPLKAEVPMTHKRKLGQ